MQQRGVGQHEGRSHPGVKFPRRSYGVISFSKLSSFSAMSTVAERETEGDGCQPDTWGGGGGARALRLTHKDHMIT